MLPMNMMVCPHDTASNPDRWFRVTQYLGQRLDVHLHLQIALDFADFRAHVAQADLAYANALETLRLIDQCQWVPIVRPVNVFDEVVFVAGLETVSPSLADLARYPIASVAASMTTHLAMHILKRRGIQPAGIANFESWTGVIGALWRGEFQYGLVYKDTYDEFSEHTKSMVKVLEVSQERMVFHTMLVGNRGLEKQEAFRTAFLHMHHDEQGNELLHELGIAEWVPTDPAELDQMRRIALRTSG